MPIQHIASHSPTTAAAAETSLVPAPSDGRATAAGFTATVGLAAVAAVEPPGAAVGLFLISDVLNDERSRLERRNRVRLKKFSTMRGLNIASCSALRTGGL